MDGEEKEEADGQEEIPVDEKEEVQNEKENGIVGYEERGDSSLADDYEVEYSTILNEREDAPSDDENENDV